MNKRIISMVTIAKSNWVQRKLNKFIPEQKKGPKPLNQTAELLVVRPVVLFRFLFLLLAGGRRHGVYF